MKKKIHHYCPLLLPWWKRRYPCYQQIVFSKYKIYYQWIAWIKWATSLEAEKGRDWRKATPFDGARQPRGVSSQFGKQLARNTNLQNHKYKFAKLQIQIYKFIQIQTYTFWWSQATERRLISVWQTTSLKYKSIHILVKIMFDVDFDDFDIDVLFEVYANVNDGFEAEVDV